MSETIETMMKRIGLKFFVRPPRETETLSIEPGSTVADVLNSVGLGSGDFSITNPTKPDEIFQPGDNLYARVEDGEMLAVSALVDAGRSILEVSA